MGSPSFGVASSYAAATGCGTQYTNAKGLLTGTRVYQLDDPTKYTVTATYYDSRGRVVQTKATNHLGGTEAEYIAYDFLGHPTKRKHVHTYGSATTELYTYTYDHAGRLLKTTHKLDNKVEQILAQNTYDELGRVLNHKAGNSSVINTTYGYNVRSWTSSIAGTHFKETLDYNYDGNINKQIFGDNSSYSIQYDFVYDDISRLTGAFSSGTYGSKYQCTYDYDKQGNPTSIITNGVKMITASSSIDVAYDNLAFTYNGNQLKKVTDAGDVTTSSITEQFNDYANADTEYAYNANGAMTKDLNKGISSIQYNLLNLPQQVDILSPVGEARNTYSYAADGTKLQVVKKYNSNYNSSPIIGSAVNTSNLDEWEQTDYVGNKLYGNDTMERILVDGGYIDLEDGRGNYYFYETDHLGSNRTTVCQSGTVIERNDYYPYGMQMAHNELTNSTNYYKYKYNNKELDVMHGLNLYDYSARSQDPALGRFTTVDPMAEKYYSISPYAYCMNNPVNAVDPDGESYIIYYKDENGKEQSWEFTGNNQKQAPLNAFVYLFLIAYNYNEMNGGGEKMQEAAANKDIKIGLKYTEGSSFHEEKGKNNEMINWNPFKASQEDGGNGYTISPATILEHETDHAMQALKHPKQLEYDKSQFDDDFKNKEERRVETGSEMKTANSNGEIPVGKHRTTHYGIRGLPPVSSPISNEPGVVMSSKQMKAWSKLMHYMFSNPKK